MLRRTIVQAGHTIGQAGSPLEKVYFPETALISAVVEFSSGESIDGVLIGSEGVFGASAAFGVKAPLYSSIVQRAGTCWVMPASELRRLIKTNDAVRSLLFRYQHFLVAQAQQNVACAARHEIRERMCGYLLRVRDDRGEIRLTQEHLARTLGVRRTSVSTVAGTLQRDGIISNQRGRIRILDPGRLRSIACECHHAIETFKRSLIEPPVGV